MVRSLTVALLLSLLTCAMFWPVTRHGMCSYDDYVYLDSSGRARSAVPEGQEAFAGWHPLSWASLRLDDQIFGPGAFGHHLGNVLLHALNAGLVFLFLSALTGSTWRSALAAAIFGLHPLRVEPVAWISERKEVQAAFFGLLTLLAYVYYCRAGKTPARIAIYLVVLGLFGLALFSKPTVITLPCVMLLLDFFWMRRTNLVGTVPRFPRRPVAIVLLEKLPMFALAAVSAQITYSVQAEGGALSAGTHLSLAARLANVLVSYVRYLGKSVWFTSLALPYPLPPQWPAWSVLGSAAILIALTVIVVINRRDRPALALGWLWFLGVLVPMIGFIQPGSQAMADRYSYLPSIGLLIAVIWSIPAAWTRSRLGQGALVSTAAAALVTLAIFTHQQIGYWSDNVALFTHALQVTSDNADAHGELATIFLNQGRLEEAETHFREALRIEPRAIAETADLAKVLARRGRYNEAIEWGRRAVMMRDTLGYTHLALGEALDGAGRTREAAAEYRRAIELAPHDTRGHFFLAALYNRVGDTARSAQEMKIATSLDPNLAKSRASQARLRAAAGDFAGACAEYEAAIRENPSSAAIEIDFGALLSEHGNHAAAMRHFNRALELEPNNALALVNRAFDFAADNKPDAARADYERALTLDPNNADAHLNFANLLFSLGDAKSSIPHSRRALELSPGSFEAAFNLAAAEAELGQLDAAAEHYRLAVRLQPNDADARRGLAAVMAKQTRR